MLLKVAGVFSHSTWQGKPVTVLTFFTFYSVQPELTSVLRTGFVLSSVSYVEIFMLALGEMKLSGPL